MPVILMSSRLSTVRDARNLVPIDTGTEHGRRADDGDCRKNPDAWWKRGRRGRRLCLVTVDFRAAQGRRADDLRGGRGRGCRAGGC